ncbi:MAG TPA: hypothetical protein VF267_00495 [Gammaproteobacteria bacterium]
MWKKLSAILPGAGSKPPLHLLQDDIELLARYAVETRHRPGVVDTASAFLLKVDSKAVTPEDIAAMTACLKDLMPDNTEVTPETLRATAAQDGKPSPTGRYLRMLWSLTLAIVLYLFSLAFLRGEAEVFVGADAGDRDLLENIQWLLTNAGIYFEPFVYGLLGSCTYLMRVTGQHLRDRTFDPRRISEHINRLILGCVAGGIIILFIDRPGGIQLSEAALGFLAGYSIEFLFKTIDRVIEAVLPKVGLDTVKKEKELWRRRVAFEIETVERQLATAKDQAQKLFAEETLGRLRGLLKD